jgi:hypothetical protein
MTFLDRVQAAGLTVKPEDLPKLEALVKDMDRAAAQVNTLRPYSEEPLSALRLKPAG